MAPRRKAPAVKRVSDFTLFSESVATSENNEVCFYCPGCDDLHRLRVGGENPPYRHNNDLTNLTITPTITLSWGETPEERQRCRFQLIRHQIRYFSNCTHEYAGKSLMLPSIPQHILEAYEIAPF
jgi:hypothetical protein